MISVRPLLTWSDGITGSVDILFFFVESKFLLVAFFIQHRTKAKRLALKRSGHFLSPLLSRGFQKQSNPSYNAIPQKVSFVISENPLRSSVACMIFPLVPFANRELDIVAAALLYSA